MGVKPISRYFAIKPLEDYLLRKRFFGCYFNTYGKTSYIVVVLQYLRQNVFYRCCYFNTYGKTFFIVVALKYLLQNVLYSCYALNTYDETNFATAATNKIPHG